MLGNIRFSNTVTNSSINANRTFECHPGGEPHGQLLLGLASAGIIANASVAGLIMARKTLRRWSSGLLIHGTVVDAARSALLIPLAISVIKCQPVTRCSIIDTAFLLLATVSCLNLLTASLSDAPLLPPPVLVPSLLRSAGFSRSKANNKFTSPLYPKGGSSYYSDYYEEDANLLDETTAMPDSPQCVLFGSFMVWFAALTINLGPTFLSGGMAAQSELSPNQPGCPLVRGPDRHVVLNILWAAVNLLCIVLTVSQLRKLKRDLTRARIGLLAAAGAGLAGLAGIAPPDGGCPGGYSKTLMNSLSVPVNGGASGASTSAALALGNSVVIQSGSASLQRPKAPPPEIDVFLRRAQKNGHGHIRTLGTLAVVNLLCWVPIYVCALIAPVGTGVWEDPAPTAYEMTLIAAFAHSTLHPLLLIFLHEPLRSGLRECFIEFCCCFCQCCGIEFRDDSSEPPTPIQVRDYERSEDVLSGLSAGTSLARHSGLGGGPSRSGSHPHLHSVTADTVLGFGSRSMESLNATRRTPSLKSNRSFSEVLCRANSSASCHMIDDGLPPPPLPPINAAFRKQVSMELQQQERDSPLMDNRW